MSSQSTTGVETRKDPPASSPDAIRINLPREVVVLPMSASLLGLTLGFIRGSRTSSLRFLAENAHRRPTTVQGWYFYNKTKNYRVLLGGMKQGAKESLKLGLIGLGWVGIAEGWKWIGHKTGVHWLEDVRDIVAGGGTAGAVSAISKWSQVMALAMC
jgi:hypothetical protein